MKKKVIRISLLFVLIAVLSVGLVSPVSAAPPERVTVEITDISVGSMSFNYSWEKVGAHFDRIIIYQDNLSNWIYDSGAQALGGRTPSKSVTGATWVNGAVTAGHTYYVQIRLYTKNGKPIKRGVGIDDEYLPTPP